MKKALIFFIILISALVFVKFALAEDYPYQVFTKTPKNSYNYNTKDEKILFIVDFSNSMNDKLGPKSKLEIALETIEDLLTKIPEDVEVGLRVYGQRPGLTYVDGCTATKLLVPLGKRNGAEIREALYKTRAQGWTPITYSLKQAVNKDFAGVEGPKKIILLTDGGENCDESPCTYSISLMRQRDDIKIDVIALDLYDMEANNQLRCSAYTTRGRFYQANDKKELEESLKDSFNIDKEVRGTVKVK